MSAVHEAAGREFAARLKDAYSDRIGEVILFGSAARDDARGRDSDVDVLVTVREEDDVPRDRVHEIAFEVTMAHGVTATPHVVSRREYATASIPLFETVARDGIAL